MLKECDIAVIGGGFYGAFIATEIKKDFPDLEIALIEKEGELFSKASSTNQGQFHMGYMYSADPELAQECARNISKFTDMFGDAIDRDVTSLYAIHESSQISADDFASFCQHAGLPLTEIRSRPDIFGAGITRVFSTAEKTFNSDIIKKTLMRKLTLHHVRRVFNFQVERLEKTAGGFNIHSKNEQIRANAVFNVTFADINNLHLRSGLPPIDMQHDTFLHFVLDTLDDYPSTALTVIRGPFASIMPSSFRMGNVLASGRFRRIHSTLGDKPSEDISAEDAHAIYLKAVEEARSYLPVLDRMQYRGYTVGTRSAFHDSANDSYTSKAITFQDYGGLQDYHVVLAGKVSCMFDVSEQVRHVLT